MTALVYTREFLSSSCHDYKWTHGIPLTVCDITVVDEATRSLSGTLHTVVAEGPLRAQRRIQGAEELAIKETKY